MTIDSVELASLRSENTELKRKVAETEQSLERMRGENEARLLELQVSLGKISEDQSTKAKQDFLQEAAKASKQREEELLAEKQSYLDQLAQAKERLEAKEEEAKRQEADLKALIQAELHQKQEAVEAAKNEVQAKFEAENIATLAALSQQHASVLSETQSNHEREL